MKNFKLKILNSNLGASSFLQKLAFSFGILYLVLLVAACGHYQFHDVSIPADIKTVKVNIIQNRANYINPQLAPQLTDKLKQKIVGQTRLTQTNSDNADWIISPTITGYSFTTSGISNQQQSSFRITVAVSINFNDQKTNEIKDLQVSRNFDVPSSQTIQQADNTLLSAMVRDLSDDIFNRIFSNW